MKRTGLSIALYMSAVFISGAVVGAIGYKLYAARTVSAAPERFSPQEYRRRYVDMLRNRLRLDDSQTSRISEVLDRTDERFREFRERHHSEFKSIQDQQTNEIRAMLNPTQQAEYAQILEEREKRRQQERHKKPPRQ